MWAPNRGGIFQVGPNQWLINILAIFFRFQWRRFKDAVSFRCNIYDGGNKFKIRGDSKANVFNEISPSERMVIQIEWVTKYGVSIVQMSQTMHTGDNCRTAK